MQPLLRRLRRRPGGAGQGEDAGQVDDKGRAELRRQAVAWLRAELAAWAGRLKDDPKDGAGARRALGYWKSNIDLASLRDAEAVDKLPEDERDACRKLWADVNALLQQGAAAKPPTRPKSVPNPSGDR